MLAKEVPGVTNVFLTLLKGHLFPDGIGLVSHMVLRVLMGIYVSSWVLWSAVKS